MKTLPDVWPFIPAWAATREIKFQWMKECAKDLHWITRGLQAFELKSLEHKALLAPLLLKQAKHEVTFRVSLSNTRRTREHTWCYVLSSSVV